MKKSTKRILSMLLVVAVMLSVASVAFAAGDEVSTLKFKNFMFVPIRVVVSYEVDGETVEDARDMLAFTIEYFDIPSDVTSVTVQGQALYGRPFFVKTYDTTDGMPYIRTYANTLVPIVLDF
ncbi:MAG: hypothetical protein ACI4JR_05700 [Acutalibacteraceae bacterium]